MGFAEDRTRQVYFYKSTSITHQMYKNPAILLTIVTWHIIFAYPSTVSGEIGFITTIEGTKNNNTLANMTAEAQIPPYSSFVLLAYCPPSSLDLSECKTLIFPVLSEQAEIIR
jgi:hypothetical protein